MPRIVPLTGTEANRRIAEYLGQILTDEIHTTDDQQRLFYENTQIGTVYLGTVADQAAMLALRTSHARGCWPGDICIRTDEDSVWRCISNNGALIADWVRICYRAAPTSGETAGRWEPVANGDPDNPEVVFADGDIVMAFVET